jgi:hypothetical protein
MNEEKLICFLFWIHKNCLQRTTSRANVYSTYWQVKDTGLLLTHKELIKHWEEFVYKEPVVQKP